VVGRRSRSRSRREEEENSVYSSEWMRVLWTHGMMATSRDGLLLLWIIDDQQGVCPHSLVVSFPLVVVMMVVALRAVV